MFTNMVLSFSLLATQNGSLDIQVEQQEVEKSRSHKFEQYDTSMFDDKSKQINDTLKEKQKAKQSQLKNNLFQTDSGHRSRIDETKHTLFKGGKTDSDKAPYVQQKQESQVFPYFLMSIGAFLTIGFVIYTIMKQRKRGSNETTSTHYH